MKTRRIYFILLSVLLITALVLCGTVIAYMFRQTEYKDNQFTPAEVSCEALEVFDGEQKTSIQIKNTGNIDSYLRIRLVSYWIDTDGNIVGKPSEMPVINIESGWIKGTNTTYYYQKPVAPDMATNNLLSSPVLLEEDENGYLQVIEVFAEAIQSKPQKAVMNSWSVSIDSNGNITDAP